MKRKRKKRNGYIHARTPCNRVRVCANRSVLKYCREGGMTFTFIQFQIGVHEDYIAYILTDVRNKTYRDALYTYVVDSVVFRKIWRAYNSFYNYTLQCCAQITKIVSR